jgi:hypothetical protein
MIMPFENLPPINLGVMGLPMKGNPDIITPYTTPYPMVTNYIKLCKLLNLKPFGGGTKEKQGPYKIARINSGYRNIEYNKSVGGKSNSAHLFALAWDIEFVNYTNVRNAAIAASDLFNRVIMYGSPFLHVDLTNSLWNMMYSNGMRFGLCDRDGNFCWRESIHQIVQLHQDIYG